MTDIFTESEVKDQRFGFEHGGAPTPDSGLKWVRTVESLYTKVAEMGKERDDAINDMHVVLDRSRTIAKQTKEPYDHFDLGRRSAISGIFGVAPMEMIISEDGDD